MGVTKVRGPQAMGRPRAGMASPYRVMVIKGRVPELGLLKVRIHGLGRVLWPVRILKPGFRLQRVGLKHRVMPSQ